MNFHTIILRESKKCWVSLCLENGLVAQGETQQQAIDKLQEAIASFEEIYQSENNIYSSPLSIKELHEFLTIEEETDIYELRKVYA